MLLSKVRQLASILLIFSISVTHAAPNDPVIGLSGNGVHISDNGATDADSGTNFGTLVSGSVGHVHTFNIHNRASQGGVLKVKSIVLTGANPDSFSITQMPSSLNVGRNEAVPFLVNFHPASEGIFNAAIDIESDDPVTPHFIIKITGTGAAPGTLMEDLRVVVKLKKPKYDTLAGTVRVRGKATIYNVGTLASQPGVLRIYHQENLPLITDPPAAAEVPFLSVVAALPGKKPKKTKVSFDTTFTSADHAVFFRAIAGNDADTTDNFTYGLVFPN